jgi:hypothetical protein
MRALLASHVLALMMIARRLLWMRTDIRRDRAERSTRGVPQEKLQRWDLHGGWGTVRAGLRRKVEWRKLVYE